MIWQRFFFSCKSRRLEEIHLSAQRFLKVDLTQDKWVEKRGRRGEQEPERPRTLDSTAKQTVVLDPLLLNDQDTLHTTIYSRKHWPRDFQGLSLTVSRSIF